MTSRVSGLLALVLLLGCGSNALDVGVDSKPVGVTTLALEHDWYFAVTSTDFTTNGRIVRSYGATGNSWSTAADTTPLGGCIHSFYRDQKYPADTDLERTPGPALFIVPGSALNLSALVPLSVSTYTTASSTGESAWFEGGKPVTMSLMSARQSLIDPGETLTASTPPYVTVNGGLVSGATVELNADGADFDFSWSASDVVAAPSPASDDRTTVEIYVANEKTALGIEEGAGLIACRFAVTALKGSVPRALVRKLSKGSGGFGVTSTNSASMRVRGANVHLRLISSARSRDGAAIGTLVFE